MKSYPELRDKSPLSVVIVSFDWHNLCEHNPERVFQKMTRDGFRITTDTFFTVSWSTKTYYKKLTDTIATYHMKARFMHLRPFYDFLMFFKLPFILRRYKVKPDIVVVHDFPQLVSLLLAKWFFNFKAVLFVTHLPHELLQTRRGKTIRMMYERVVEYIGSSVADIVYCINETTKQYAIGAGIPEHRIRVFVSNTILRDKHIIENTVPGQFRKTHHVGADTKIIVSVGRLEPEKGMKELIDAYIALNDNRLVLYIAGDGVLREELEQHIQDAHVEDRVHLLGFLEREDMWSLYKDADMFILLSQSEGLGLVFWEAMYMGIPVVGSRVGGIVETIGTSGERGFFWDKEDGISRLKEIVEHMLFSDTQTAQKDDMLRRAKAYVDEKLRHIGTVNTML